MRAFIRQEPGKPPIHEPVFGEQDEPLTERQKDAAKGLAILVARTTGGFQGGPLRLRWQQMTGDQVDQVVALTKKGDGNEPGETWSLSRLGKRDRKRWEAIVEQACGRPNVFQDGRDWDALKVEFRELAAEIARPPRRVALAEEGSVTLPRRVFTALDAEGKNPAIQIATLGIYAFVLLQLENGKSLSPGAVIEGYGDDAVLVIDVRLGLGGRFGEVEGWKRRIEHLGEIGWLQVERKGLHYRVARGEKTLAKIQRAA